MYKQILYVQWRALRLPLVPLVLSAFALPLASVRGRLDFGGTPADQAAGYVAGLQGTLPAYPALAAVIGVAIALGVWAWDRQGGRVYARALPVSPRKYVAMKLGAGASLLALPGLALWAGALLATASIQVPTGLTAYPTAVAVRFGLASLLAYTASFAMSAWSGRTALVTFSALAGALVLADITVAVLAGTVAPGLAEFSPTAWVLESAVWTPGPFGLFTGNWSLIDV